MKKLAVIVLVLMLLGTLCACGKQQEPVGKCTLSISCETILGSEGELKPEKQSLVPADGWILAPRTVEIFEGESVFDVLRRVTREEKIHMEFSTTPIYNSAYVEGIGNLYEFDCGSGSGWMLRINGAFPNVGASNVPASDGDVLEWCFTRNRGADLGASLGG